LVPENLEGERPASRFYIWPDAGNKPAHAEAGVAPLVPLEYLEGERPASRFCLGLGARSIGIKLNLCRLSATETLLLLLHGLQNTVCAHLRVA